MALFLALFLGHVFGDFVFQPGRLVVAKRRSARGVLLHTGVVLVCTGLALLGDLASAWPAIVLAGLAHLAIEYLSIHARKLTQASGLALFILDQALHLVSLAIIAVLLGRDSRAVIGVWDVSVTTLAVTCGLLTVMFFGSILAFEVRMKVLGGGDAGVDGPILRFDGNRVLGFAERGIALGLSLVSPVPLLGALAFVPRMALALTRSGPGRARHMSDAAVGVITCSVAWFLIVLYTVDPLLSRGGPAHAVRKARAT